MGLAGGINIPPQGAAFNRSDATHGIYSHSAHQAEVDHQAIVAHRVTSDIVATGPNGDRQITGAGVIHGSDHVICSPAPGDYRGPPVDHRVPDGARFVKPGRAGHKNLAGKSIQRQTLCCFQVTHDAIPFLICLNTTPIYAYRCNRISGNFAKEEAYWTNKHGKPAKTVPFQTGKSREPHPKTGHCPARGTGNVSIGPLWTL
jgi:hypothetical protein